MKGSSRVGKYWAAMLAVQACVLGLLGPSAPAADFTAWPYRMPITFSGYSRSETLTNFPALVVLGTNLSGFSYSQFASVAGNDLRFADATGTELNYEIESWGGPITAATQIAGCRLWLRADAGVLTNGSGLVTNWVDQSGYNSGAVAPTGQEPLLVASGLNGKPVIRFDGTDDCLRNTSWAPGFTTSGKFTYFFVSQLKGVVDTEGFFAQRALGQSNDYDNNSSLSIEQESTAPGGLRYYRNTSPNIQVLRDNSVFRIDTLMADSGGTYAYQDGVAQGTGAAFASALNPSEYAIGARLGGGTITAYGEVDFAEIIIFTNALDTTQMNQVGAYLAQKYGLSTSYVYSGPSHVWVQVPSLSSGGSIDAYWGNAGATSRQVYTTNGATWSSGFRGVWHLNELVGNVVDSTVNKYVGVNYNTVSTNSVVATGRFLDGTGDYFSLTGLPSSTVLPGANTPISISVWAKPRTINAADNDDRILTIYDATASSAIILGVGQSDNAQLYEDDGTPNTVTGTKVLSVNNWYHLACTYDGTTHRLLVNGAQDATINDGLNAGSADTAHIGAYTGASGYFDGSLDEVRLHSVGRSTNWVWAEWFNMASNSTFSSYATVQAGSAFNAWQKKMKITFSGYSRGETLTNFPALVVFSETNINQFAYSQFSSTNGYDLRFADATESTALNYEIESWATNTNSYVWVQVPALANGTYIWAYWGNPAATTRQAYTTNGATWSQGFVGVWHMSAPNSEDSGTNTYNATSYGTSTAAGIVDGSQSFSGAEYMGLGAGVNPLQSLSVFSLGWWMKESAHIEGAQISSDTGSGANRFIVQDNAGAGNYVYANGSVFAGDPYISDGTWHHYTLTVGGLSAGPWLLYRDGLQVKANTWTFAMGSQELQFGKHGAYYFQGGLDEIRISNTALSSNWVWATWLNTVSNNAFGIYSSVVAGGAAPAGELPFIETFEDRTVAFLNGQNNWVGVPQEDSQVQRDVVYAGSQAAILGPDSVLSHSFTNAASLSSIWVDFYAWPVQGTNDPSLTGINPSAAFYVNTNGNIRAVSNDSWVTLSTYPVSTGQWYRFTMGLDYLTSTWELHVADSLPNRLSTAVATNLPFSSSSTNAAFTSFEARHWWFVAR